MSEKKNLKNVININYKPFPSVKTSTGIFNGFSVEIFEKEDIKNLYENCFYGKGSFSRSTPACLKSNQITVITENQLKMRNEWKEKFNLEVMEDPEIVQLELPPQTLDSTEETEDPSTKKRKIDTISVENPYRIQETLDLFLEEAFFLHHFVHCLTIKDLHQNVIQTEDLWKQFCSLKHNFVDCFVAYLYLKSKNWVIRTGAKFGVDFLLYKEGPSIYHSAYMVLVRKAGETTHPNLFKCLYRVSETTRKEIVFLDVYHPENLPDDSSLENLDKFKVSEVTQTRFNISNS